MSKNVTPQSLGEWIADLIIILDAERPDFSKFGTSPRDQIEYASRLSAWETQELIRQKLKYALDWDIKYGLQHDYVWVGHEPYYEKDVLELLNKNERLRGYVDELRKQNKIYEDELRTLNITEIQRVRRV